MVNPTYVLERLYSGSVIVVGDVMLDTTVTGCAGGVTAESGRPIPVFRASATTQYHPGGAANAAANIHALGAKRTVLVGVVGVDTSAEVLTTLLDSPSIALKLARNMTRPTTVKTRYRDDHSGHVLRVDREATLPVSQRTEEWLIDAVRAELTGIMVATSILISDYGKGVVTPRVCKDVIALARDAGCPVIADPKGKDWTKYAGATLVIPNLEEAQSVLGRVVTAETSEQAVCDLAERVGDDAAILLKLGPRGICLYDPARAFTYREHGHPVNVPDAIGAGDTVAGTAALVLAVRGLLEEAASLANAAAAVAVGKRGTATVRVGEVEARLRV